MAFCRKCGSKLDEATGLCPRCDGMKLKEIQKYDADLAENKENKKAVKKSRKRERKAQKKAYKKNKRAQWSAGRKIRGVFLKFILTVLLLGALIAGALGTLAYFEVADIPFLSDFKEGYLMETINEKNITVEEKEVAMKNQTEGTADVVVKMPDYEQLFQKASLSENPEWYLLKALLLEDYEIQEFKEVAKVTVENGEKTIHSDEVVRQLLEEALIRAVNALSEDEK